MKTKGFKFLPEALDGKRTPQDLFDFYMNNWLDCDADPDFLEQAFELGVEGKDLPDDWYNMELTDMDYIEDMNSIGQDIKKRGIEAVFAELRANAREDNNTDLLEDHDFDAMVEALEENEDLVECQECFDLFPKADCMKQTHGYVCPTCRRQISITDSEPKLSQFALTNDLYTQEFPDIAEYAPETVKDWNAEPTVMDALDALIADEVEAIDGYEEAEEIIEDSDHEDKDELLKTIEHIKEEEEEHIEELKDDCPECEVPTEAEIEDKTEAKESEESADTTVEEANYTKHKAITHSEEEKTELKETYEKLFEQKLDEEALNEIWPFDGKKKVRNEVDSVFSNGYLVYALPSKVKHEATTIEKAVELCKAMSKKAPKDKVFIFPKAIPDAQLKGYDPELQKLIDQKNDFAAAIMTMQNGKSLEDKIKSFAKFKQNIDKQNEIINNAASDEGSGTDARAGLAADEVPAEATETADADLEDPIEEVRGKALETLGTKESADKYTEESYAKYSAKYDDYLAKIKAAKKLETLTDRYIPQLPRLVEKIKALLEEKPADTELETEVADDTTGRVDATAGDGSAEPEETKEAKAKKKKENGEIRSALRAAGMSEVAIQKLFDKGAIQAIRKALGEGLSLTTENLKSILTESTEDLTEALGYDCPKLKEADTNKPGFAKFRILSYFRRNPAVQGSYGACPYLTSDSKFKGLSLQDSTRSNYGMLDDLVIADNGEVMLTTTDGKQYSLRQALKIASPITDKFSNTRKVLYALKDAVKEAEKS